MKQRICDSCLAGLGVEVPTHSVAIHLPAEETKQKLEALLGGGDPCPERR